MAEFIPPHGGIVRVEWATLDGELWVGSRSGVHAGRVQLAGVRFRASDGGGWWLGDYPTLPIARRIVESAPYR
jgi:hypothetical protein